MGDKGRRGRLGGVPKHVAHLAENYQSHITPPYDADDIISAFESGFMYSQTFGFIINGILKNNKDMIKNDTNSIDFKEVIRCMQDIATENGAESTALTLEIQDGWEIPLSITKQKL